MKIIIQIVLWVVIIFLGYQLYNSINGPIKFNEEKEIRYAKVIDNLKDITAAELAYQEVIGNFTGSYDSLVRFIDTAQFALTARRDTSFADVEKNKAFGLDAQTGGYYSEKSIIDTLGFVPVKDSLFGGTDRYKRMMNIPLEGINEKIELKTGYILKNDVKYSVFRARVSKDAILGDLNRDLLIQEKQTVSVEGVNGKFIQVGSLDDINTSGNWPKKYDFDRK